MKVTIVTPCFNAERWIEATLVSIRAQTYPQVEHVVVDGGSTDRTLEIVRSYPEVLLLTGPDEGMYDALNKGFSRAKGQIFAYLNSDDLYYPDTVARIVQAFSGDPWLAGVYSDVDYIDEQGNSLGCYHVPRGLDFNALSCRDFSLIPQPTAFWRREAHMRTGGFDPSYRIAGDFDFFLKLSKQGRMAHLGRPLAQFRLLSSSLTMRGADRTPTEVAQILDRHGVPRDTIRAIKATVQRVWLALRNMRHRASRRQQISGKG